MHTRASTSELVTPLAKPERTLNRRPRRNKRVPFERRDEQPENPREVYLPILDITHFPFFLNFLEFHDPMVNPDDEPMWAADRIVALTPGPTIPIPATANEFTIKGNYLTLFKGNQFDGRIKTDHHKHIQEFIGVKQKLALFDRLLGEIRGFSQHDETLTDAWRRMKELLTNFSWTRFNQRQYIKIFYHGLNEITQETLNAAAGRIFLYKTPNQAYQLLEDKVLLKVDWAKNQKPKTPIRKTVAFANEGIMNSNTDKIMARMDDMTIKMDAQYKEMKFRTECNKCGVNHSTAYCNDDDTPMSREVGLKEEEE
ncbi:hypothetical protein Tco_0854089, partial [Tanacetum coccineum]